MSLIVSAKHQLDRLMPHGSPQEQYSRRAAWARMETLGLPSRQTETWKYLSLAPLDRLDWSASQRGVGNLSAEWSKRLALWSAEYDVAVQIDGRFQPHLSTISSPLKLGLADVTQFSAEDGFSSLSLSIAEPGLRIEVPTGLKVKRPLLVMRLQQCEGWVSTLDQLVLGADAELHFIEIFAGAKPGAFLRTNLMDTKVGAGASLTWVRRQDEPLEAYHFHESQVQLLAGSRLQFTQVSRGACWSRGQLRVGLGGGGAHAQVHGLTFGVGSQQSDQRVVLEHHSGETTSSQLFKGVYRDSAKGSLNGKIYIARNAQKVSSLQMNHNLLLSADAEANTKPELEIYADDVKANHGATVGRLDGEKMFYLRSRGLSASEAEAMLSDAFTRDVFMKIPNMKLKALAEVGYGY